MAYTNLKWPTVYFDSCNSKKLFSVIIFSVVIKLLE